MVRKSVCSSLAAIVMLLTTWTGFAQTTATDTVTVSFSETDGIALLGIGDCYTGTGSTDGPLLYYALVDDVTLEYTLTAGS